MANKQKKIFMCFAILLLWITCNIITPLYSYADELESNILILQSYNRGHAWTDSQINAILAVFDEQRINYMPYVEYLDWKRYPEEESLQMLFELYKYKYSHKRIDLIITTDDAALTFALKTRSELFSNAPIVFSGVLTESADVILKGHGNYTGVVENSDAEGTIDIALRMLPGVNSIYMIHDQSESGLAAGQLIKNASSTINNRLNYIDLSQDSLEAIINTTAHLDKGSIVVIASYNFDANHVYLPNRELAKRIANASSVPVFTMDEALLGTGCIGGSLASGEVEGSIAGELAVKIIKGETAGDLPIVKTIPKVFRFDYAVMEKFNISVDTLPQKAVVLNKPFSLYENYKEVFFAAFAIIGLLFTTILVLLVYIKQRRNSEAKLRSKNDELTSLYIRLTQSDKELIEQQQNIYKLAYHNSVTGLPNRNMLSEMIDKLVKDNESESVPFTLMYLDLDNFKDMNEIYGHITGDGVLHEIAERLIAFSNEGIQAFSFGGDEFVILLELINSKNKIDNVINTILKDISKPIMVNGNVVKITASAGIVIYPQNGRTYLELLKNADIAMYKSKETQKGTYSFFDKAMGDAAIEKTYMQQKLNEAMEKNELFLHYQPQVCVKTKDIVGFETLIRWNSAELGFVPPLRFIGMAEESNLIIQIGKWVLHNSCDFVKRVNELFHKEYWIAVNISVVQLMQDDFVDMVKSIISETGIKPYWLELEITESVVIKSINDIISKLALLKEEGIRIALDDFGTGYSSLSYLNSLPISVLKIDKAFVNSLGDSDQNRILTKAIIEMGHALGIEVVAEGVETDYQEDFFTGLCCDRLQGYKICKPIPEEAIIAFLMAYMESSKCLVGQNDPSPKIVSYDSDRSC